MISIGLTPLALIQLQTYTKKTRNRHFYPDNISSYGKIALPLASKHNASGHKDILSSRKNTYLMKHHASPHEQIRTDLSLEKPSYSERQNLLLRNERLPRLIVIEDSYLCDLSLWFVNIFHDYLFCLRSSRASRLTAFSIVLTKK